MAYDDEIFEHGWFVLGYERDFSADITPINVGKRRLMVVKHADGLRAFNATCPHRGTNLGYSGKLDGCSIVCGFHDYRIQLGNERARGFAVKEYKTLNLDGILFGCISERMAAGFEPFIHKTRNP